MLNIVLSIPRSRVLLGLIVVFKYFSVCKRNFSELVPYTCSEQFKLLAPTHNRSRSVDYKGHNSASTATTASKKFIYTHTESLQRQGAYNSQQRGRHKSRKPTKVCARGIASPEAQALWMYTTAYACTEPSQIRHVLNHQRSSIFKPREGSGPEHEPAHLIPDTFFW